MKKDDQSCSLMVNASNDAFIDRCLYEAIKRFLPVSGLRNDRKPAPEASRSPIQLAAFLQVDNV
jgi:hypothetical protein